MAVRRRARNGTWLRRAWAVREVDPQLRAVRLYLPQTMDSALALRIARRVGRRASPVRPGVTVAEHQVRLPGHAPVRVLSYRPAGTDPPSAALLWLHGGGTMLGTPEHDHAWSSELAQELGLVVFGVDYRLAPEHPFPAGLDDCLVALRWLHAEADVLGLSPDRLAVGGASAGGGLAAALAQRATDEGVPVCFQLLLYPMLDDRTGPAADHGTRGRLGWTPRANRFAWTCYLGRPPGAVQPATYAVPARRPDLTGLPPAWIGTGALDLFHDEDVEYARRLRRDGVPCTLRVVPGMYHAADVDHPDAPSMRRFRRSAKSALASALVGEPPPRT